MQSTNRRTVKFGSLNVGDTFQLVNRVMGGAIPESLIFEKSIDDGETNAICRFDLQPLRIENETLVEIVNQIEN